MLTNHIQAVDKFYPIERIVGIFSAGSHNYGLNTPDSDIDTKCIITPSLKEISLNHKPTSKTLHLPKEEQCDVKDIRAYMECFTKQNLNFMEILFSKYFSINPIYEEQWNRLVSAREAIVRMNPSRALQSMLGIAMNKKRLYIAENHIEDKFLGYNPKEFYQFLRIYYFTKSYLKGLPYEQCMKPEEGIRNHILDAKNGYFSLFSAQYTVDSLYDELHDEIVDYCAIHGFKEDTDCRELLDDVCYEIMKIAIREELK